MKKPLNTAFFYMQYPKFHILLVYYIAFKRTNPSLLISCGKDIPHEINNFSFLSHHIRYNIYTSCRNANTKIKLDSVLQTIIKNSYLILSIICFSISSSYILMISSSSGSIISSFAKDFVLCRAS